MLGLRDGGTAAPVAVAGLLTRSGLGLKRAHALLERITRGERCAVDVVVAEDPATLIDAFRGVGIDAATIRRPAVDAKTIREDLDS